MTSHRSSIFLATRITARIILPARFQVQIVGLDNLPTKGPALLIPKHQQWWDVPLLGTYIPRPLHFLAKQELFANLFSRFFISRLGGISIDREHPLRSLNTFRSLHPLLKENAFLVLFPEGTYYRETMGPGKWRLIQLILRLQQKKALPPIPFLPLGIRYSSETGGKKIKVEISIGPALFETSPLQAEAFTQELLSQVKALSRL
ncbi:MAG: lysophospholipid acyltransferase family protein [Pseudomonadota bacterium]